MHALHRDTKMRILALLAALLFGIPAAHAQSSAGQAVTGYLDANGKFVQYGASSGGGSAVVPAPMNVVSLDVSSVTTGGTAVTALLATHANHGGFLVTANAAGICVNSAGGAAGTSTSGDTICVGQNIPYSIPPTANAISVNSSASSVTFAGNGLN